MSDARRRKPAWRSSKWCSDSACVEMMRDRDGHILLRNSLRPETVLRFPAGGWSAFLSGVTRGDFD